MPVLFFSINGLFFQNGLYPPTLFFGLGSETFSTGTPERYQVSVRPYTNAIILLSRAHHGNARLTARALAEQEQALFVTLYLV